MADSDISFILNLDGEEFSQGISEAKEKVERLIAVTKEVGIAAGVVAAAYMAVKTSLDLTLEAENIKAINDQFERLTKNAGIATDTLKTGLMSAAAGLVDDTDLMRAANRSIIEMGVSASKLPELMQVARLATAAFGGEILQNFEALNQAIATGSTRGLKNLGIIIDQDKALRDYARAHNVVVSALSDAERKQATLNAVLEKGKTAFAGVNPDLKEAHNLLQQTKVALGQVGEAFTLAFDKVAGPTVKNYLKNIQAMAEDTKRYFVSKFGDGAEQAQAQTERLSEKVMALKGRIIDLEQVQLRQQGGDPFAAARRSAEIAQLTEKLKGYQAELDASQGKLKTLNAEAQGQGTQGAQPGAPEVAPDNQKRLAAEAKFNQDLLQLSLQRVEGEIAAAQTIEDFEIAQGEKRVLIRQQIDAQIEQIRSQRRMGEIATDEQANLLIEQIEATRATKLQQLDQETKQGRLKALDQYVNAAQGTADGVARAFEAGAKKSQMALNDWGATGMRVFNSFGNQATSALQAWGAGTKSAADAAKGFIFGMIADEAEARGKMMLLASIWPPNPAGLAAGAGLIALSGFLRAQSGGAGAGGGGGSAAAAGGAPAVGTEPTSFNRPEMAQAREQKSVTLQIMGNYFETDQTKNRLVEMIREASDATDFTISGIGG